VHGFLLFCADEKVEAEVAVAAGTLFRIKHCHSN